MLDKRVVSSNESSIGSILMRFQDESKQWEAEGKDAWSALKKLGGTDLPRGDEVILARKIYAEFAPLKRALKAKGMSLEQFCEGAGLGAVGSYSKEIHRLMLAPDAQPEKIRVRRSASKYRWLIAAMARLFNVSRSTLANRMMVGTSLHPANAEFREEVESISAMLQAMVDRVDEEFGLFAVFMETAALKAKHAEEGGSCRWPQDDAESRSLNFGAPLSWLLDRQLTPEEEIAVEASRTAELDAAMNPARAYWEKPVTKRENSYDFWFFGATPSGCWMDDKFFHVPHAYLGYGGDICNTRNRHLGPFELEIAIKAARDEALESFAQYGETPTDDWDEETQSPCGQLSSMEQSMAHYHAWLVVYPSPDNTTLMPMLLVPVEECGPILIPLDAIALKALSHAYWVSPDGQTSTFLDRIKSLIGYQPGQPRLILESLRRTAPWLSRNPFMKIKAEKEQNQEYMRRFCMALAVEEPGQSINDHGKRSSNS